MSIGPTRTALSAKAGFDWQRVKWAGPDEPEPVACCYCGTPIADGAVPLRMWSESGHAVVFCDPCAERWFGLKTFDDEAGP
jgi:hypothetical protein